MHAQTVIETSRAAQELTMASSSASVSTRSIPRRLLAIGIAVLVVALALLALALRAGGDSNTAPKSVPTPPTTHVMTQVHPAEADCLQFQVHTIRVC
jgi:hypothetical protein